MAYSKEIEELLKKLKIKVGDSIKVARGSTVYEGLLMPRIEAGDVNCLVVKLDSGYNVGIEFSRETKVEKQKGKKVEEEKFAVKKLEIDPKKPTIAVLATGGTIVSRVDYKTGGAFPAFSADDLASAIPELAGIANLRGKLIRNMLSEDMVFEHYSLIAREIEKEIKKGADGIIVLHGTDTMHFTSAALSFMLRELPVPVILVGAQRSSDRGSSDAAMNLICATHFIANSDFAEVAVCMHGSESDDYCVVLPGTKVRKMHTSRRDAFRAINTLPWARIDYASRKIEFLRSSYAKKDKKKKLKVLDKTEKKVGLLKTYPGIDSAMFEFFLKENYKGLVIEGTGLGHAPVTELDEFTKENARNLAILRKLVEKGCVVVMTSQCVYGRVNMNVYANGREILRAGVISGEDMLPEVAYLKLKWLLGNYAGEKAKEMVSQNIAGEISEKRESSGFLV
ncbi:MAG: Glu-tRNA(Gln) amidotransferase subunit GatD [Candidatus Micrarchaeota archaeon]